MKTIAKPSTSVKDILEIFKNETSVVKVVEKINIAEPILTKRDILYKKNVSIFLYTKYLS